MELPQLPDKHHPSHPAMPRPKPAPPLELIERTSRRPGLRTRIISPSTAQQSRLSIEDTSDEDGSSHTSEREADEQDDEYQDSDAAVELVKAHTDTKASKKPPPSQSSAKQPQSGAKPPRSAENRPSLWTIIDLSSSLSNPRSASLSHGQALASLGNRTPGLTAARSSGSLASLSGQMLSTPQQSAATASWPVAAQMNMSNLDHAVWPGYLPRDGNVNVPPVGYPQPAIDHLMHAKEQADLISSMKTRMEQLEQQNLQMQQSLEMLRQAQMQPQGHENPQAMSPQGHPSWQEHHSPLAYQPPGPQMYPTPQMPHGPGMLPWPAPHHPQTLHWPGYWDAPMLDPQVHQEMQMLQHLHPHQNHRPM
ncbi:uncharacterized protein BJ171DRAFT_533614 [Polychytrium aggregatum]|uniref:uncharacterized protein n=1 Tax=Polychytrium aggregatum TaxID=110093 RepID=UPI0022FDE1D2|nr:uncharacterized protein BJ171DRAFT_533614 [Polychytrium aggregatum]KAI9193083.1 hypothetical protein BJ171DRAFT_533614 [Polychytrium aggregatum]